MTANSGQPSRSDPANADGQRPFDFDAFISYRRRDSADAAAWLRTRLTRFRPPSSLLRRLSTVDQSDIERPRNFFLDTAYQIASEDFWVNNIEPALRSSRFLIVLASEGAFERLPDGGENWVEREIRTFLQIHNDPGRIILVLPPGGDHLRLPTSLAEASERWDWVDLRSFRRLPWRWLSLRRLQTLESELLKVVARLFSVPRALIPELTQEATRRRARVWITAATTLGLSTLALTMASTIAWQQARSSHIARSLAIANTAQRLSDSGDHGSAALVALESSLRPPASWFMPHVPEVEAALFRAISELRERQVLRGHKSRVYAAHFNANGHRLVSAGGDRTIRVWDVRSGVEIHRIDVDAEPLTLLPPGSDDWTSIGLANGRMFELNISTGAVRSGKTIAPATGTTWSIVSFSPDGEHVLLIGNGGEEGKKRAHLVVAKRQTGSSVFERAFVGEVRSHAWSPDGATLVFGSNQEGLFSVNLVGDPQVAILTATGAAYRAMAFSGNGRLLLVADKENVSLWLTATNTRHVALTADGSIVSAAINADGSLIALGRWDNCIELWDVALPKLKTLLNTPCRREGNYPLSVNSMSFTHSGELVSASDDRKATVWDPQTGQVTALLVGHADRLNHVATSRDGQHFATLTSGLIGDRHDIYLWSRAPALAPLVLDHGTKASVELLALSDDERRITTATDKGEIRVWSTETGREIGRFELGGESTALGFLPDNTRILVARERRVLVWDSSALQSVWERNDITSAVPQSLVEGQRFIGMAGLRNGVELLDMVTGRSRKVAIGPSSTHLTVVAATPDGRRIAYGTGRTLFIADVASAREEYRIEARSDIRALSWSPREDAIFVVTEQPALEIWRPGEASARHIQPHTGRVASIRFSLDGSKALSRSANDVYIFEISSGRLLAELGGTGRESEPAHEASIEDARFSPDGDLVVTGSYDRTARIWKANSGRLLATLSGHGDFVRSAQFTTDGRRVVTSSVITENSVDIDRQVGVTEAKVIVWDITSAKPVAEISGEDQSIPNVLLSRDGRRLITASFVFAKSTRTYVWPLFRSQEELATLACQTLTRELTATQRRTLLKSDGPQARMPCAAD